MSAPLPTITPSTFGEFLRACREREGLKQHEVGTMIGADQAQVSRWELDTMAPDEARQAALVGLFPSLVSAPRPRQPGRRKYHGRARVPTAPPPKPAPAAAPAAPPVSSAVIAFSVAVVRFVDSAASGNGKADVSAVVTLLRRGSEAGLSAAEIAAALETGAP